MFSLNNIASEAGSRKKSKRLWRWNGSGKWTYCGRWLNGQNCRAWGGVWPWFEWGQTPLFRRMPKLKGFSNANFTTRYSVVNVSDLEILAQKGITEITKEVLVSNLVVREKNTLIKVLGDGEITSKITLKINKVTSSALEKIQKAGWSVELI
jgi:large subunit ribosomal protein L15